MKGQEGFKKEIWVLSRDNDSQCGARKVSLIASNSRSFDEYVGGVGGLTRRPDAMQWEYT